MSKKCKKRSWLRKDRLRKKFAPKRSALRLIVNNPEATIEEKFAAQKAFNTMPRDAAACRTRNRCWKTGRAHGVYRLVGMCRNMFRIHAMQGDIPGIHKASW